MAVRIRLFLVICVTLIAAAGIYLWQSKRAAPIPNAPPELASVTVAQVGEFFIYLPLYYAQDRKFFEREGLKLTLVNTGGDDKSVASVIAGAADFGVGDPTFAAIAKEQGQDVKVIASVVNGVPFWGVTRRPNLAPITAPNQLKGLSVATFPKPSTAYVLQEAMFRAGSLKPSIREAQFGSLLPLLDSGAVDIVLELEPNVSTAVANGGHVVYSLAEAYPDFAITGVTTSGKLLAERPVLARRFFAALDAAEKAAHANPTDLIAYAEKRFPDVPPAVARAAAKRMLDAKVFPTRAQVSESGWRQAISLRLQSGDLKNPVSADGILASVAAR